MKVFSKENYFKISNIYCISLYIILLTILLFFCELQSYEVALKDDAQVDLVSPSKPRFVLFVLGCTHNVKYSKEVDRYRVCLFALMLIYLPNT